MIKKCGFFPLLLILLFQFIYSSSASADYGPSITVPAYPGLQVRVRFEPESISNFPLWKVEIRNNYSAEIYIEYEVTDIDETLTSVNQLTNGVYIQPGQSTVSGDQYLKADAYASIMVWLGNLRIGGISEEPFGVFSTKANGDAAVDSGSTGGVPTTGTPTLPPTPDPCAAAVPAFTQSSYSLEISAQTPALTLLADLNATDVTGCTITYRLASTNGVSNFSINDNGELFLQNMFTADPVTHPGYNIRAIADNGVWLGFADIHISYIGTPSILIPSNQLFFLKNTAGNGTRVGQISTSFYKGDINAVQYTISAGDSNNSFSISNSGVISVSNALPLNTLTTRTTYTLTIQGTDGLITGLGNIKVVVTINDSPTIPDVVIAIPQVINDPFIGRVNAFDPDLGPSPLSYSFVSGNDSGYFKIDHLGRIYVLDPVAIRDDNQFLYTLSVRVSDSFNSATNFTSIQVIPNRSPLLDVRPLNGETKTPFIQQLRATDADGNKLFFSILSGNEAGVFEIRNNGLYVIGALTQTAYALEIGVNDTLATDSGIITINFSNRPKFDNKSYFFPLPFQTAKLNLTIGTVTATDIENDAITYSISPPNAFTSVDPDGRIYFIAPLETYDWNADSYNLKQQDIRLQNITASDGIFSDWTSARIAFLAPFEQIVLSDTIGLNVNTGGNSYTWNEIECSPNLLSFSATKEWVNSGENYHFELVAADTAVKVSAVGSVYGSRSASLFFKDDLPIAAATIRYTIRVTDLVGNQLELSRSTSFNPTLLSLPADYFDYQSCIAGYKKQSTYQHSVSQSFRTFTVGPKEIHLIEFNIAEPGTLRLRSSGDLDLQGSLRAANLSEIASDDDSGLDSNFDMTLVDIQPGDYVLKVISLNNEALQNITVFTDFTANQDPQSGTNNPPTANPASTGSSGGGGGAFSQLYLIILFHFMVMAGLRYRHS